MKSFKNDKLTRAYIAFAMFFADRKTDMLVNTLRGIEKDIKGKTDTDKGIWFRFFKNDTGATTIADLENTFKKDGGLPGGTIEKNKEYMYESISFAVIDLTLEMYYS